MGGRVSALTTERSGKPGSKGGHETRSIMVEVRWEGGDQGAIPPAGYGDHGTYRVPCPGRSA